MIFITEDFLLHNPTARRLYHEHAQAQPIVDYHCHLSPADIASNRSFTNLHQIWLEGDHYKWRAMRAHGVEEHLITGGASPKEKFIAFAQTLPNCLRNPLYHWSHLELKRYFGIDTLLNGDTAEKIWDEAKEKLASPEMSAHGILDRFKVSVVGTTDDPTDDLHHHINIAEQDLPTKVYPTYRPDKALNVDDPDSWNGWVDQLAKASGVEINDMDDFLQALEQRHAFFHQQGGRLSDHGLEHCFAEFPDEEEVGRTFSAARSGQPADERLKRRFASFLMARFAAWDHSRGWTKQLHLGAMRNNNKALYHQLGADIGVDSIGDFPQGKALGGYLGHLSEHGILPRMVLYNLNPADNYLFATMAGNFQQAPDKGKIQFGSGWWFLDQKEAMIWQINALSNLGLLGHFVGMLTDSRSFMSYCRHEYFRRILCQLLGEDVENGELPDDPVLLGRMVENISYFNAAQFFGFKPGTYSGVRASRE